MFSSNLNHDYQYLKIENISAERMIIFETYGIFAEATYCCLYYNGSGATATSAVMVAVLLPHLL